MNIENTLEYLKTEFGVKSEEELNEAAERVRDIDIGLFVSLIPMVCEGA